MNVDLRDKQDARSGMEPIELPTQTRGRIGPYVVVAIAVVTLVTAGVFFVTNGSSAPTQRDVAVWSDSLAGIREQGPYVQVEPALSAEAIQNSGAGMHEQGPYVQGESALSAEAIQNSLAGAHEQGPYAPVP